MPYDLLSKITPTQKFWVRLRILALRNRQIYVQISEWANNPSKWFFLKIFFIIVLVLKSDKFPPKFMKFHPCILELSQNSIFGTFTVKSFLMHKISSYAYILAWNSMNFSNMIKFLTSAHANFLKVDFLLNA